MDLSLYIARKLSKAGEGSKTYRLSSRISIVAIALGIIALVLSLSILEGFDRKLHDTAKLFTGEVRISSYSGSGFVDWNGQQERTLMDSLERQGYPVASISINPVITGGVIVSHDDMVDGFGIVGIGNKDMELMSQYIVEGSMSGKGEGEEGQAHSLIISEAIRKAKGLSLGDTLSLTAALEEPISSFGMPPSYTINSKGVVKGIYRTGMGEYDKEAILTTAESAKKIFFIGEQKLSNLLIRVDRSQWNPDDTAIDSLAAATSAALGYPYWASSARNLHYQEFMWIELQKEPIPLVLSLIIIVAAFTVMTTMLIGTVEKTRQYGILRALGLEKKALMKSVVWQSLGYGAWGVAWGLGISLSFLFLQSQFGLISLDPEIYFIDSLPVEFVWGRYLFVLLAAFVLLLLASLLPIYYTAKSSPIKAINYR